MKTRFLFSIFFVFIFALPLHTHAQGWFSPGGNQGVTPGGNAGVTPGGNSRGLTNPIQTDSIEGLLLLILDVLIQIGTVVIVVMIVWVGFKFVLAQGNSEQLQSARSMLMWVVVGALIILGARIIVEVLQATVESL